MSHRWPLLLVMIVAFFAANTAPIAAQDEPAQVSLQASSDQVGLLGAIRPGNWAAMKLSIKNTLREARTVRCEWIMPDADGDPVHYSRLVTLTPGRSQYVWLYGAAPTNTGANPNWRARVVDSETGEVLASTATSPSQILRETSNYSQGAVGIIGPAMLGLEPYTEHHTQHEPILILRGLRAVDLPDRWHGLSMLDALIWTPAIDPTDASFSLTSQAAVRQWVRRGGHLVICMSSTADPWYDSPLSDMLPEVVATRHTDVSPSSQDWLGLLGFDRPSLPLSMYTFLPLDPDVAVVLRERGTTGEPVAVARAYGMGRVTVIGLDLSQKSLLEMNLPNGPMLWRAIFGWQSPAYSSRIVKAEVKANRILGLEQRSARDVAIPLTDSLNPPGVGAGAALFIAIIFFIVYWLAAAPASYFLLRQYQLQHLSWLVFILAATVFSIIAWGGAYLMRPSDLHVQHTSVVDINLVDNIARVQSWTSLMVPRHGTAQLNFGEAEDEMLTQGQVNTIRTTVAASGANESDFLVQLPYVSVSASPNQLEIPVRSTIKPVEFDYLASVESFTESTQRNWLLLQNNVMLDEDGQLVGDLAHGLGATLKDVRIVLCPGFGRKPMVRYLSDKWASGSRLILHTRGNWVPLVGTDQEQRPPLANSGLLDAIVQARFNERQGFGAPYASWLSRNYSGFSTAIDVLSFYNMLPPPPFRSTEGDSYYLVQSHHLVRHNGRNLDLSHHTPFSRLIVIGEIDNASLPVPLRVDDESVESSGTTVVRWIVPLHAAAPATSPDVAKELSQ